MSVFSSHLRLTFSTLCRAEKKISPIETALHYRFATPKFLKTHRAWGVA